MPMNLDYVIACYGIWLVTIIYYVIAMKRKQYKYNESLLNLTRSNKSENQKTTLTNNILQKN